MADGRTSSLYWQHARWACVLRYGCREKAILFAIQHHSLYLEKACFTIKNESIALQSTYLDDGD